jgi:hypothetical protein
MVRRYVQGLAALGLFVGGLISAASCGPEEGEYTYEYPAATCDRGLARCSIDDDCWGGLVHEGDATCIDDVCQCAVPGYIICNAKGHPIGEDRRGCRDPIDCQPGEVCFDGVIPDAGEAVDAAPPPPPPPECTVEDVSGCAGPADKRCGAVSCVDGKCALEITPGPIASQRAGDCKQTVCGFDGKAMEVEDTSDYYDDGVECTFDMCVDGVSVPVPIMKTICPDTGEGYCSGGACVQCTLDDDCSATEDCWSGRCVPKSCMNNVFEPPLESDEDCGGPCLPCNAGKKCNSDADCKSQVCTGGKCQLPNCNDNEQNDGETDIDCGIACDDPTKLCGNGDGCLTGDDCESHVCWSGKCLAPTCTDGVQNDKETGVDCGGACSGC